MEKEKRKKKTIKEGVEASEKGGEGGRNKAGEAERREEAAAGRS